MKKITLFITAIIIGMLVNAQSIGEIETKTLMEVFGYGFLKVLPIIIVSYVAGLTTEIIFAQIRGHEVPEGFFVSGMLIPLILPVGIPLWMVAVATVFAVIIGVEVFGGSGMNILNPALTARAFLFFAYPTWMSGDKVWVHGAVERANEIIEGADVAAISGETILGSLAQNNAVGSTNHKS